MTILNAILLSALLAPPVPLHRAASTGAALDSTIVVAAGRRADAAHEPARQTDLLDTKSQRWRRGADLPTPRAFPAGAALDGRLMVIGGVLEDDKPTPVVETYHLDGDRWSTQPPLPTPRSRMGACTIDHRVYVAGGIGEIEGRQVVTMPTLERWDPTIASWEQLADMHHGRHGHAVVAYEGEAWVIGGYAPDITDSVEIFNPRTGEWRDGPALPEPRGFPVAGVVGDRIVVINSRSEDARTSVIFEDGAWHAGPPVPDDRHRCAAGVIADRIYLISGDTGGRSFPDPHTIWLDLSTGRWGHVEE